jgi:hypothetical protein
VEVNTSRSYHNINSSTTIVRIEQVVLNYRNSNCRCRVPVPEGTVAERVEDVLSGSETDNALLKAHRGST